MPSIHIRIPDPLHGQAKAKADEWGVSLNQMLVVLVAQGLEPRVVVNCQPAEAEPTTEDRRLA